MSSRIGAIDFWRGLALIAILVDHVPGNGLEYVTPRNFGFSDSAEAFVFLSGLAVGAVYVPRARRFGALAVARACLKRAWKLYGVHLACTLGALAIFLAAYGFTGIDDLISPHGRSLILSDPSRGLPAIAALSHQIGYFNILPLYIALMIWAPAAVALMLYRPWLALAVSVALYAAARAFDLNLPNWPEDGHWFFNPLAWQLLFTCGVAAAGMWRQAPRAPPFAMAGCLIVAMVAALLVTDGFGLMEGLRADVWATFDVEKQNLGLMRLAHFFALAFLAAALTPAIEATCGRLLDPVRALGRHSLPVFALGSILAALGQAAMTVGAAWGTDAEVLFGGAAYTLAAIVASFGLARRLDGSAEAPPAWGAPQAAGMRLT